MRSRILTVVALGAFFVVGLMSGTASATIFFSDNFDDRTQDALLAGTSPQVGGTWAAPAPHTSADANHPSTGTNIGISGMGAGFAFGSGNTTALAPLTQTISTGTLVVSYDVYIEVGGIWELSGLFDSTVAGSTAHLLHNFYADGDLEMYGPSWALLDNSVTGFGTVVDDARRVRITTTLDVGAQTASTLLEDLNSAASTTVSYSYTGTFAPDHFLLYSAAGSSALVGIDNVTVIPEPGTLGLLGLGGLMMVVRFRRSR